MNRRGPGVEHSTAAGGRERGARRPFSKVAPLLVENRIKSFCVVPLTTAFRRLGAMGFGSLRRRVYEEEEVSFMEQVARLVAVAKCAAGRFCAEKRNSPPCRLGSPSHGAPLMLRRSPLVVSVGGQQSCAMKAPLISTIPGEDVVIQRRCHEVAQRAGGVSRNLSI